MDSVPLAPPPPDPPGVDVVPLAPPPPDPPGVDVHAALAIVRLSPTTTSREIDECCISLSSSVCAVQVCAGGTIPS